MKLIKQILQSTPPRFFFVTNNKKSRRDKDIFDEVFEVLNEYRARRAHRESIIVESHSPLTDADRLAIREFLGAPGDTPIIERRSVGVGATFQMVHNGTVYTLNESNRLERLKSKLR
jgi:hypothetical protein